MIPNTVSISTIIIVKLQLLLLLYLMLFLQASTCLLTSMVLASAMVLEKVEAFTLPCLLCHLSQMGLYASWKLSVDHNQKVCFSFLHVFLFIPLGLSCLPL